MTEATATVVAAYVSGALVLLGTIITVVATSRKSRESTRTDFEDTRTDIAVLRTELNNLKNEVRKHNDYASRVPKLEAQMQIVLKEVLKNEQVQVN